MTRMSFGRPSGAFFPDCIISLLLLLLLLFSSVSPTLEDGEDTDFV